jgi:hypothetical protein
MIELSTLGAIVGFIGGGIVLFDRYYKGRPIASLSMMDDEGTRRICIRIKNITAYDIAILNLEVKPPIYHLAENLNTRTIIKGVMGQPPRLLLGPDEERRLIIAPLYDGGLAREVSRAGRVNFYVNWRSGNSTWWWRRAVPVCTHTETIRAFGLPEQNRGFEN